MMKDQFMVNLEKCTKYNYNQNLSVVQLELLYSHYDVIGRLFMSDGYFKK
jgi:hypothetical protein